MTIGVARDARGTRLLLNFQNITPIWPPRLREIIKMAITPSDSMTIDVAKGARGTRLLLISKKINMAAAEWQEIPAKLSIPRHVSGRGGSS